MEVASINSSSGALVLDDDTTVEVDDTLLCENELMDVSSRDTAVLSTALTGANNDLDFTAKADGSAGNAITITYTDPGGASAALSVSVVGSAITVNLGRAASAINTTATLLKAAIEAKAEAAALVTVANKTGNDGSGLVTALTATPLAGGGLTVVRAQYGTLGASHTSKPVYEVDRIDMKSKGVEVYYFGDPDADTVDTENYKFITTAAFVTDMESDADIDAFDEDLIVPGQLLVHFDGATNLHYHGRKLDGTLLDGDETLDLA